MNSMYKVPLIVLLTLVLVGLSYIGWRSWKPPKTAGKKPVAVKKETKGAKPPKNDGAKKPPELAKTDPSKIAKKPESKPLEPPVMPGEKPAAKNGGVPAPQQPELPKPEPPKPELPKPEPPKPVEIVKPLPKPAVAADAPKPPQPQPAVVAAQQPAGALSNVDTLLAKAETQFKNGMLVAARELVYRALKDPSVVEYGKDWFRAVELLNKVHGTLMNSSAPAPEKKRYRIKPGDSLSRIAKTQKTTVEALQRLNELSKTRSVIHPGNNLYYIEGIWSIKVSKSQFTLCLYLNDNLYRVYKVGVGRQDRTPVGVFEVMNRIREPSWAPPGREMLPYGHPENIIGTRWMGLKAIEGTDPNILGYGIHGTIDPDSVGTPSSAGCVRLRNEEVEELFDFIPEPTAEKTRVVIVE